MTVHKLIIRQSLPSTSSRLTAFSKVWHINIRHHHSLSHAELQPLLEAMPQLHHLRNLAFTPDHSTSAASGLTLPCWSALGAAITRSVTSLTFEPVAGGQSITQTCDGLPDLLPRELAHHDSAHSEAGMQTAFGLQLLSASITHPLTIHYTDPLLLHGSLGASRRMQLLQLGSVTALSSLQLVMSHGSNPLSDADVSELSPLSQLTQLSLISLPNAASPPPPVLNSSVVKALVSALPRLASWTLDAHSLNSGNVPACPTERYPSLPD